MKFIPTLLLIILTAMPAYAFRPEMENEKTYISENGEYMIHYALDGNDAIRNATDREPENGLPDLVDFVIRGVEKVRELYIEDEGWAKWLPDEDGMLDLYFINIPSQMMAAGYCTVDALEDGTFAPYIVISVFLDKYFAEEAASHEAHHAIQMSYNPYLGNWIYEAQSTHVEYRMYGNDPGVNSRLQSQWASRLHHPERSLNTYDGNFEYTSFPWLKYIVDRNGGDLNVLIKLWEEMGSEKSWYDGHNSFFEKMGMDSFEEEYSRFMEWNIFACDATDQFHYLDSPPICNNPLITVAYEDVQNYPFNFYSDMVEPLGSNYIRLEPTCDASSFTVRFEGDDMGEFLWGLRVVGVQIDEQAPYAAQYESAGGDDIVEITVHNQAKYEEIFIIAQNLSRTKFKNFEISVTTEGKLGEGKSAEPGKLIVGPEDDLINLKPGDEIVLKAVGAWGNCDLYPDLTDKAAWFSSDETVLALGQSPGKFIVQKYGVANAWATYGELESERYEVEIKKPAILASQNNDGASSTGDNANSGDDIQAGEGDDNGSSGCNCRVKRGFF